MWQNFISSLLQNGHKSQLTMSADDAEEILAGCWNGHFIL